MRSVFLAVPLLALSVFLGGAPPPERQAGKELFPAMAAGWQADGKIETYDRDSVYKYMDGGAEVYIEYGMKSLRVQRYAKKDEPPIVFDLFEMDSAAGAYGAFTFEREDEEAGIGQASEYGGGLLRFWQGRFFGFIQAEKETPASKAAILALGKAAAAALGPAGTAPPLSKALPDEGLRPLSVRYIRSPLLLEVMDPIFFSNPLGLGPSCEAVEGRYGPKGSTERVLVVRFANGDLAIEAVDRFGKEIYQRAAHSAQGNQDFSGWRQIVSGRYAILILDAPDPERARNRAEAVRQSIRRVSP